MIETLVEAMDAARAAFDSIMVASSDISEEDLLAVVGLSARVSNVALGVQAVAVARFASRDHVKAAADPESGRWVGGWVGVDRGPGHVADYADCSVGTALGFTTAKASALTHHSAKIVADLPATLAAMGAGLLDPWRAHAVALELRDADPGVCAQVEARVFPAVLAETAAAARGRVRRAVAVLDPDAATRRATAAHADRDVQCAPGQFAMTDWWMRLPAATSAFVKAAMDARAHELRGQDTTLTAGQARADAIVDLVLSNATVTATVALTIPVHTTTTADGHTHDGDHDHHDGDHEHHDGDHEHHDGDHEHHGGDDGRKHSHGSDDGDHEHDDDRTHGGGDGWGERDQRATDADWAATQHHGTADSGWDATLWDATLWDDPAWVTAGADSWCPRPANDWAGRGRREGDPVLRTVVDQMTGEVTTWARPGPRTPVYDTQDPRTADDRHRDASCPPQGTTATGHRVPAGWAIPGVGIIDAAAAAAILNTFSTRITAVLLDHHSGTVIGTSTTTYTPPRAMADLVRRRDGTCRFPACTRAATRCDLDHIQPWPTGDTTATNLATLCRHHHRAKTHDNWRYTMDPHGTCTWTSPHGDTYVTHPVNHHLTVS